MQTKGMSIEKMDEHGVGLARIATLSTVDKDGDTYAPGAFGPREKGQWVPILPAHVRVAQPLGKALVYEQGDAALAELHFNLDTQDGREWHSALKFDLEKGRPAQEYSYGFEVIEEERRRDGVRVLKQLDVHEVSPVVRGAGEGTGTISLKHVSLKDSRYAELTGALALLAADLPGDRSAISATGAKQLEEIHAAIGKVLAKMETRLAQRLNARLDERAGDDAEARDALIDRMADAAGIERGTVLQILRGEIAVPPEERLRGFARVLGLSARELEGLVERGTDEAEVKAVATIEGEMARHIARGAMRHLRSC